MSFEPRPYQAEAITNAVDFFQEKKKYNALQILPTGSGKSVVIANIASKLNGKTVVFQPSKEILAQNFAKFSSYGFRAGIYSASAGMRHIDDVTFATIGSVAKKHHLFKQFKHVIIDECFPYEQNISTEKGKMKIGTLFNIIESGKTVPKVLSWNELENKMEMRTVITGRYNGIKPILRLIISKNISIKTTDGHPFLTNRGWVKAGDLISGDCLLASEGNGTYAAIPNEDQEALIFGGILGDGSVDRTRKTININRFRFVHGADQEEYLRWKCWMLQGKVRRIEKNGFAQKSAYAFASKVMYFKDSRCNQLYAIDHLNAQSLAVAWMDDGHLAKLENCGTLYSTAGSKILTEKLCLKLKSFGIIGEVRTDESALSRKEHFYIQFGKNAVNKISFLIARYVHPSMGYKLCKAFRSSAGAYPWCNKFDVRGAAIFIKSERIESQPVYNIQVEGNETYVLTSQRYSKKRTSPNAGLIVHNCHLVNADSGMYRDFISSLDPGAKVLGLTATPYRLESSFDGAMLKFLNRTNPRIFNKVNYYIQNEVLFNAGHLSKLEYYSFDIIDRGQLDMNSSGTDFTDSSLKSYLQKIDMPKITIGYANRLLSKRPNLLIFCSLISEANKVCAGVPGSVVVTGDTDPGIRDRILKQFKAGIIKCVINVGVLTTGFDYPELSTVLIARSTMSLALYYQIVGRCMRPHDSKESGWVVDLGGNIKFFGKIETMRIEVSKTGRYSIWNNGRQLTNVNFQKL